MRYGGGKSAWLRRGLLAGVAVGVLVVLGVLAGMPVLRERSQHRLERQADREVTATAQKARGALLASPAVPATALRAAAEDVDGVEVLAVEDAVRHGGIRLVFRVRVAKTAASVFGWQRTTAVGCFAQVVRPATTPALLERVPCAG
ncbi:hypothetical protein MRQ36_04935 [Micromonospora sp. R77]|uniref:hypothetical protein n=1 Tax=Micromonospora sp. R77 TaxID=2925836 RepID=UPI001F6132CB|nr:hypothetical protein [Micromonospora sp. R77]MCI4061944.1 hypothetical protein [Micromonospora sp. R77]